MLAGHEFVAGRALADAARADHGGSHGLCSARLHLAGATIFAFIIYGLSRIPVIRTIMPHRRPLFRIPADERDQHSLVRSVRAREGVIGTVLLAILIAHQSRSGGAQRSPELFRPRHVQRAAGEGCARFLVSAVLDLRAAGGGVRLHGAGRDRVANVLTHPLAHLSQRPTMSASGSDDGTHYRMQLVGPRGGQPGPAHRGRPAQLRRPDLYPVDRPHEPVRDPGLLRGDPVVALAGFTFPGTRLRCPGLLVWVCVVYALLGTWLTH